MPSFGRLTKHSNRAQQAAAEQLSAGSGSGVGSGSASPGAAQAQTHGIAAGPGATSAPGEAGHADSLAEGVPQSALSAAAARTSSDLDAFVDAHSRPPPQAQQLLHHQHKAQQHQTQHQLQQPSFPPHLFNPPPSGAGIPPSLQSSTSGVGGSSGFDGHQSQSSLEFADAAAVSQRYGAPLHPQQLQQQHRHPPQEYGITPGSVDDLPAAVGYHHQQQLQQQQPPQQSTPSLSPAPEKRSTRKLIKGIFGSGRQSHDTAAQQQQNQSATPTGPYDNTAGLARRPSKRVSNPPDLKTTNLPQAAQLPPDEDWQPKGPYAQQKSPLLAEAADVDEYLFYAHGSNIGSPIQNSRIFLGHGNGNSKSNSNLVNSNNGARQLSAEHLEASDPYDQDYQPPDHPPPDQQLRSQQTPPPQQAPQQTPLQRQGTIRAQELQSQYESQQPQQTQASAFDHQSYQARQQAQQHSVNWPPGTSQRPYQPQPGDTRITTSQLASAQQLQNAETISQLSHDSPVTETDPRSTFQAVQAPAALIPGSGAAQDISASNNPTVQDQPNMAPPAPGSGPQPSRADKALRGQLDSLGQPPGYHRQSKNSISANSMPPSSGRLSSNACYP